MPAHRVGEIGDVSIFTIPPARGQSSKSTSYTCRAFHPLAALDFAFLKLPPETKQTGIQSQCIAREMFLFPVPALIQNRLQIPFQMRPAELLFPLVLTPVCRISVTTQNARKHRAQ